MMTKKDIGGLVKTWVVVFFTHTNSNWLLGTKLSATMKQPSSVVHNRLQNTQPLNTQRKHSMQFKILVGNCYMHALLVSRATRAISWSYAGEKFSRSRFRGWGWLLMCHASSTHRGCSCGLESITEASSQAMVWPLLMACSATAEVEELALLRACLCSLRLWD